MGAATNGQEPEPEGPVPGPGSKSDPRIHSPAYEADGSSSVTVDERRFDVFRGQESEDPAPVPPGDDPRLRCRPHPHLRQPAHFLSVPDPDRLLAVFLRLPRLLRLPLLLRVRVPLRIRVPLRAAVPVPVPLADPVRPRQRRLWL